MSDSSLSLVSNDGSQRLFKTRWFAAQAHTLGIADCELAAAAQLLRAGSAGSLGGGVWRKRLGRGDGREIILLKRNRHFFCVYARAGRAITDLRHDELRAFQEVAGEYANFGERELDALVASGVLMEIRAPEERRRKK
ncbi:MAG: hypothetical protein GAK35_01922 [Herbaspirillum frisingense]|uniref:Type II toxin-antitoxin system RelE/ParE family toxin n=1 Tax=Herbaspirillum frisingense TaxID=92645 RepID=A0A7V8FX19_9BURK|nr:MAG: hypothetical protein GAK35_01922 [Herbaspirillum frisingense]